MWVKVRRGGISALVALTGASLLQTSIPLRSAGAAQGRTLNLRVSTDRRTAHTIGAWVIRASKTGAMRAAHLLTGEARALAEAPTVSGRLIVVRVKIGKRVRESVLTNASTVGQLLDAMQVAVRRLDELAPEADDVLDSASQVTLVKVRRYRRTEVVAIPFETLIQYSKDLPDGAVNVLTPGSPGQATVTYLITRRNGREVAREAVWQHVDVSPVSQVEEHGTPDPEVRGGVEYGEATWYSWSGCGTGYHAAHKTLPFGTSVTVTNLDNGKTVTVTINDRGPYGTGRIIDLCSTAFAAIAPLGQGVAHVKITW